MTEIRSASPPGATALDVEALRNLLASSFELSVGKPRAVRRTALDTVRPAHEQFIEPSKRYADVIIPHGGLNRPALDVLLARVRELAV